MIVKQNDIQLSDNIKIEIKKRIKRANNSGILIVEVDSKIHKQLLDKQRIKLGWNKCRLFDFVSVLRCYKCCGYYHIAKDCQHDTKCKKCAGIHLEKDCNNTVKTCVNCIRMATEFKLQGIQTDHCANDVSCEFYKRIINRAQKNIKYYTD